MQRRKMARLAGIRGVSYSALSAVLGALGESGEIASAGTSSGAIRRQVDRDLGEPTSYGGVLKDIELPTDGGGTLIWTIICPFALLSWLCRFSTSFGRMLFNKIQAKPPTIREPWKIIVYLDECSPGNLLAIEHRRKAWQIYWAFEELGDGILKSEHNWFYFGALRTTAASGVAGGVSGVCRAVLKSFFGDTYNYTSGITVNIGESSVMILAKLHSTIGDEAALKHVWSVKGAAGHKCCFKCMNIVSTNSQLSDHSDHVLGAESTQVNRFISHTDETLWAAAERLHGAIGCPTQQFETLQRALGITYSKDMLLLDRTLRRFAPPISISTFDWVHVWLVNGIANFELFSFLDAAKKNLGLRYSHIHEFFQLWHWPTFCHNEPSKAFSAAREAANSEKFKCGASELLDMYGVLRCLLEKLEVRPKLRLQADSVFALFDVLDILASFPSGRKSDALLRAHLRHMEAHRLAYPEHNMQPKWHFGIHVAGQLTVNDRLAGTFVHERKHKVFKTFAAHLCNTSSYEKSIAKVLLNSQLHHLMREDSFLEGDYLMNPKEHRDLAAALACWGEVVRVSSKGAAHGLRTFGRGDVILFKCGAENQIAKAMAFIELRTEAGLQRCVLGQECRLMLDSTWALTDALIRIPFSDLVQPLVWSHSDHGISVLMPRA